MGDVWRSRLDFAEFTTYKHGYKDTAEAWDVGLVARRLQEYVSWGLHDPNAVALDPKEC